MDEHVKQELTAQFLQELQSLHAKGPGPQTSDKLRGAPMILHFIRSQEGNVTPSQISREMGTSTARITAVLGSLEKKGLIVRTMDPEDRRRILISLTEKGHQHVQKMEQTMISNMRQLVEYLGEEDARAAVHLMHRLRNWKPENLCPPDEGLSEE